MSGPSKNACNRHHEGGFGLLSAIIGTAVAAGGILIVAATMELSARSSRTVTVNGEKDELLSGIGRVFATPQYCQEALGNVSIATPQADSPFTKISIPELKLGDQVLLKTGENRSGVEISEIAISKLLRSSGNTHAVQLQITGKKTGGIIGNRDFSREYLLVVNTNANHQVSNCQSAGQVSGDVTVRFASQNGAAMQLKKYRTHYSVLMADPKFREWFSAATGGANIIKPVGDSIRNDEGFESNWETADKLCQFLASGTYVAHEGRGLSSRNNNFWTGFSTLRDRWESRYSSWQNATDLDWVQCLGTTTPEGQKYALTSTLDAVPGCVSGYRCN